MKAILKKEDIYGKEPEEIIESFIEKAIEKYDEKEAAV